MTIDISVLRALLAAGATAEMIVAAVEADMAAGEARRVAKRANNAERQRRFKARQKDEQKRNNNAGNALPDVTNALPSVTPLPPSPDGPLSLPHTPTQSPLNPPSSRPAERDRSFCDGLEAALRKAASLESDPSPSLMDTSPILGLIDAGLTLESHILPAIAAAARAGKRGRSWKFYVGIVQDAANARQHAASGVVLPAAKQPISDEMWSKIVEHFKAGNRWLFGKHSRPPGEPGCTIPSHILEAHGYVKAAYPQH